MKLKTIAKAGTIGIDEVGRGPLAGPVTVCAVYTKDCAVLKKEIFADTIRDSKKLTKAHRYGLYQNVRQKRYFKTDISYAISSRSAAHIDKYGISQSIRACLRSCVQCLAKRGIDIANTSIRLDAGLKVPIEGLKQSNFVKGDEKYAEIAIASIMAKVTRDKYMERLAKAHSVYGWEENVGYGTKAHREAIRKYGLTKHHRKTYLKSFITI